MMELQPLHRWLWIGPILMAGGVATIVAIDLHFPANRSLWEDGGLYITLTYDRSLPILGFGCALAQVRLRWSAIAVFLFVFGLGLGLVGEDWLISATWNYQSLWPLLDPIIGSLSCLLAGTALAAPDRLRIWILLPAALLLGAILGIAAKLNDPGLDTNSFSSATVAAALWLVVATSLTWRLVERPGFRIAGRILASWLVAIGVILGGAMLAPQRDIAVAPVPSSTLVDKLAAPPGQERAFPTPSQPQPLFGSPNFDPSREP